MQTGMKEKDRASELKIVSRRTFFATKKGGGLYSKNNWGALSKQKSEGIVFNPPQDDTSCNRPPAQNPFIYLNSKSQLRLLRGKKDVK